MTRIEVHFYGRLADRFGRRVELASPPGGMLVGEIRQRIAVGEASEDAAAQLDPHRARAVVGETVVGEDFRVEAGGSVELLPPLSGG